MNQEDFNKVLTESVKRSFDVLARKSGEYSRDDDRLSNFKQAAAMDGETPERALKGMLKKHLVSIVDMVEDLEHGKHNSQATWEEKITDAVNYLFLLEGLLTERYDWFGTKYDTRISGETIPCGQGHNATLGYRPAPAPPTDEQAKAEIGFNP